MTLAAAIRAAVDSQGVPWASRGRLGTPEQLAMELDQTLRDYAPDLGGDKDFLAALIGECAQETDWYCAVSEYGGASAWYAPWYGRGMIQLTHEANYTRFRDWLAGAGCGLDPHADPSLVTGPLRWAAGIYYFTQHIDSGYWRRHDWDSISGLINGGSAGFRPASSAARAAACDAALSALSDYTWEDTMPTTQEIVDALLDTEVVRDGLPDGDPRQGRPVTVRAILAWLDSQFAGVPAATREALLDAEVTREGLPDGDPRQGLPVTIRAILAWLDSQFAAVAAQRAGDGGTTALPSAPAAAPDPAPAARTHTVQAGETGRGIAQSERVSWSTLKRLNPGVDWNSLASGTILTIGE